MLAERETTLPVFDDPRAWSGPQWAGRTDWQHLLSPPELAELDAAVEAAIARDADLVTLSEREVPLPVLGPVLAGVRREILHGRGFVLIRGWPSGERSMLQNAMAFRIVGAHLGDALSQNGKGHVLGHVVNLGLDYADPTTRGYQTAAELRFHTDAGDAVGLLCIRGARSGGLSRIASSTTVWNEMVRRRPDLARVLTEPFRFSRWGEVGAGQKPWFEMPLFQVCDGRMIAFFVMSAIEKAQALPGVPPLTDAQREALSMVNTLAGDPAIRLDMDFRPGDMQFVCNHSILHSRTAYEDWPEVSRRRHLLRLWVSSAEGPALPESFTRDFQGRTANGRPDGIRVPGVPLVAPLEPA
ncbi:MAG: hypothetical protein RJA99_281 [Pseudomonadota bacterium]|jgi:hypothetical protein